MLPSDICRFILHLHLSLYSWKFSFLINENVYHILSRDADTNRKIHHSTSWGSLQYTELWHQSIVHLSSDGEVKSLDSNVRLPDAKTSDGTKGSGSWKYKDHGRQHENDDTERKKECDSGLDDYEVE